MRVKRGVTGISTRQQVGIKEGQSATARAEPQSRWQGLVASNTGGDEVASMTTVSRLVEGEPSKRGEKKGLWDRRKGSCLELDTLEGKGGGRLGRGNHSPRRVRERD
jgi:hypothetical protein